MGRHAWMEEGETSSARLGSLVGSRWALGVGSNLRIE